MLDKDEGKIFTACRYYTKIDGLKICMYVCMYVYMYVLM